MLQIGQRLEESLHTILEEIQTPSPRALRRLSLKLPPSNLLFHPSVEVGSLTLVLIALHEMEKLTRTALLMSTRMPTVRSTEQMRLLLC